jgi:hypothetical protein
VHDDTLRTQHETPHVHHDTPHVPHYVPHTHHDARTTPNASRTTTRINHLLCNAPPLTNPRAPPAWNCSAEHTNHAAPLTTSHCDTPYHDLARTDTNSAPPHRTARTTPMREPLANIKHATHAPGPSWPGNANHNTPVECLQSPKPKPTKRPRRPEASDEETENHPKRPKPLWSEGRKWPRLTDENEDRMKTRPAHEDASHAHHSTTHMHHGAPQEHNGTTHTRHDATHMRDGTPHAQHEAPFHFHFILMIQGLGSLVRSEVN